MAFRSGQSSYDLYDVSSDDEEYFKLSNVAESTPGQSDHAGLLLTATRLNFNSPPKLSQHWRQSNPNLVDYHSGPMEISITFWLLDITDWWRQQEETHSKYAELSNVAPDIFSIIPHGVRVEASITVGRDVIRWRQSKATGKTLHEKLLVRQFDQANNWLLAGNDPASDTTSIDHDIEIKCEVEQKKLHLMDKVHNILEMYQGSQNL